LQRDANLLFGVLAVQLRLITPPQLAAAGALWAVAQERALSDILVEQQALDGDKRRLIEALIQSQVESLGGDVSRVYEIFGGDEAALASFGGSLAFDQPAAAQFASLGPQLVAQPPTDSSPGTRSLTPEHAGRYELRGEQGRGGVGRVLLAYDHHIQREIALKELLAGSTASGSGHSDTPRRASAGQVARFLREARVTGQLQHPGIVPVHELGERPDGTVYYTMKLVRGATLASKLRACRNLAERLALLPHFLDLCQAIAYAHSRQVIHRDIKPANVMIGEFGETVLLDWGLAKVQGQADEGAEKLADEVRLLKELGEGESVVGKPIGTPSYMPPEQADGRIEDVDERSDVWSLGAVLYEILTGQPPYTSGNAFEVIGMVLTDEVMPVLSREPEAPPELAAVAMRCLQRDPAQRYQHVSELAADVAAFQTGGLVGAYTYSPLAVLRRWARQHWPVLATAGVALVVLCGVAVFSYFKVLEQRNVAVAVNRRLDVKNSALMGLRLAGVSHEQLGLGNSERASLLALQAVQYYRKSSSWMPEINQVLRQCAGMLPYSRVLREDAVAQDEVAFMPDGQHLVSLTGKGYLLAWDLTRPGSAPQRIPGGAERLAVSPDGKWIAAGKTVAEGSPPQPPLERNQVQLWDATNLAAPPRQLPGLTGFLHCVAFSPDSHYLAAGGEDQTAQLWDLTRPDAPPRVFKGHTAKLMGLAFSHDGKQLVTTSADHMVASWDLTAAAPAPRYFTGHEDQVYSAAFTPDDKQLITCSQDNTVRFWDPAAPGSATFVIHVNDVGAEILTSVAVSPDGQTLAVGGYDEKLIWLWQLAAIEQARQRQLSTGMPQPKPVPQVLHGHGNAVMSLTFSPDGSQLASSSLDATVRLWDLRRLQPEPQRFAENGAVMAVAVAADGKRLVAGGAELLQGGKDEVGLVHVWEPGAQQQSRAKLAGPPGMVRAVAISPDGQLVAAASFDNNAYLWDMAQPGQPGRKVARFERMARGIAISPDRHWLAAACEHGPLALVDLTAPPDRAPQLAECYDLNPRCVAFSPDSKLVAVSGSALVGVYRVGDVTAAPLIFSGHTQLIPAVAFSADSRRIAAASWDETVLLWPADDPTQAPTVFAGAEGALYALALSPDGRFLAAGGKDNTIRIWSMADPAARPEVLLGHTGTVTGLAFTADSTRLVSGGLDGSTRLWHIGSEQLTQLVEQQPWRNLSLEEWQTFVGRDEPYQRTLPGLPAGFGAAEVPAVRR
jgi:WD40 repeat protein/serine/threonine protein kinase